MDALEGFGFHQDADAGVLRLLAAGLEQPRIGFLPLVGAGLDDFAALGVGVVLEVFDQPELKRVDAGDVAAVGQVPLVLGVFVEQPFEDLVAQLRLGQPFAHER